MNKYFRALALTFGALAILGWSNVQSAWAVAAINTCSSISLSENPATDGDSVTVTGTVVERGTGNCPAAATTTPITQGNAEIQENQVSGTPVSCGTRGLCTAGTVGAQCNGNGQCNTIIGNDGVCTHSAFVDIKSGGLDGNGQISTGFDTTGLGGGSIGFQTNYERVTSPTNINGSTSACLDLVVDPAAPPCAGATIGAILAVGDGTPAPSTNESWTFRINVHACQEITGVTAQGGTNGWAPMTGSSASTGTVAVRNNKKNQVLLWNIGHMNAGDNQTLDVTVAGKTAAYCDALEFLSGPWSTTFSTDGGSTFTKSDYTGRVSITVTCQ